MSEQKQVTPFELLGGEGPVLALAKKFYDVMERDEPELTRVHRQADDTVPGRVHPEARERFSMFLIGWLGGPQEYIARHGHPRLRMRHMNVAIDTRMRDAWLRAMKTALDECAVQGEIRAFLDERFAGVADFMRNREG